MTAPPRASAPAGEPMPDLTSALATIDAHRRTADLLLAQMAGFRDDEQLTLSVGAIRKLCRMVRTYARVLHDHAAKVTRHDHSR